MRKTYTKEEKQSYFKNLREEWKKSKELADKDDKTKEEWAELRNKIGNISYYSFFFTKLQMKHLGLSGTPYIDAKTFKGWKENGFMVKKGEKCKMRGITWITPVEEDEDSGDHYAYPKEYYLFHTSQVEPIKIKE